MGDDDLWRVDGSFKSFRGEGSGKKGCKRGGEGNGPAFTRVIPKFLQKYHQNTPQVPTLDSKRPPQDPKKDDDEEEEELDDVQKEALDQYHKEQQKKHEKIAQAAGANQ
jgi:hypothetical protein